MRRILMNIPNLLSLFRILIIPVFVFFYFSDNILPALIVIFISALTDILDGIIARNFNAITDLGKLLDPLADKLTQATVLICMTITYHQMLPLSIAVVLKESLMTLGAAIILKQKKPPVAAQWFGKLATAFFYASMLVLLVFGDLLGILPGYAVNIIVIASLALTLFSFVRYAVVYSRVMNEEGGTNDTP